MEKLAENADKNWQAEDEQNADHARCVPHADDADDADDDCDTPMSEEELRQTKLWVETWKRAGPLLELQREEDVRKSDTISNVAAFGRLYQMALIASPPLPTSGLVEQQTLFRKLLPSYA